MASMSSGLLSSQPIPLGLMKDGPSSSRGIAEDPDNGEDSFGIVPISMRTSDSNVQKMSGFPSGQGQVTGSMFGGTNGLLSSMGEAPSLDDDFSDGDANIAGADELSLRDTLAAGSLTDASAPTSGKLPADQPSALGEASLLSSEPLTSTSSNAGDGQTSLFGSASLLSSYSQSQGDDSLPSMSSFLAATTSDDLPPPTRLQESAGTTEFRVRAPVRATTFNGRTLYIARKSRIRLEPRSSARLPQRDMSNLLDVPIHRLLDNLSSATAAKLANPAAENNRTTNGNPTEDTLWVDRYRPRRFTDLLGNERVARETMAWVKAWDWCVFGKGKGKSVQGKQKDGYSSGRSGGDENYTDEYRRPKEKLLLISGPPGLGKTTLAHVVARQAGYEVMEINASDARTAQIVDDRIKPALETGSAIGSSRPVLIVVDEIDGATGGSDNSSGFVQKLLQLTISNPRKKKNGTRYPDKQGPRPLLRPIICICNDAYAASLAKLRPLALHLRFARPTDVHIVRRLREVCTNEDLRADGRALTALVGVARGDMRGCLNALQFIKARNEDVTEPVIRAATVGMKEADSSVTSVINSLFAPLSKKRVKELGLGEADEARYVTRLGHDVEVSDQSSKVALGCFTHYASLRQHDATFARHEKATEWLLTYDTFSSAMYTGEFALAGYLPYSLVPFYALFQQRGGDRVERSQVDWDHHLLMRTNEEIYKALSRCMKAAGSRLAGAYRHLASGDTLQLELSPMLNRIISPPLRPVNSQVIRPGERALLTRLVDIMSALELQFIQERADDGQLVYRLEPPVDVFVTYDGKRASDIAISRYAVRHLVAAEIDAKSIQHKADAAEQSTVRSKGTSGMKRTRDSEMATANKRSRSDVADIADKPPTDFFGRPITVTASDMKKATEKKAKTAGQVAYKYIEGNSAAVRKPVRVNAFL